jgi:hypothetical protein
MNKESYLSFAQKDPYRNVAVALRQEANTFDYGFNDSGDVQSLKMARQLIPRIEAQL